MKPYGPSNASERPEETKALDVPAEADPKLLEKALVIWPGYALMQEQYQQALEHLEINADALMGLENKIHEVRLESDNKEAADALTSNQHIISLIEWAFEIIAEIPEKFWYANAHESLLTPDRGQDYLKILQLQKFKMTKWNNGDSNTNEYYWENTERVLRVVALYLDTKERGGLEQKEENPTPPPTMKQSADH